MINDLIKIIICFAQTTDTTTVNGQSRSPWLESCFIISGLSTEPTRSPKDFLVRSNHGIWHSEIEDLVVRHEHHCHLLSSHCHSGICHRLFLLYLFLIVSATASSYLRSCVTCRSCHCLRPGTSRAPERWDFRQRKSFDSSTHSSPINLIGIVGRWLFWFLVPSRVSSFSWCIGIARL